MIRVLPTIIISVLAGAILCGTGLLAWAVSSDERTDWVVRQIQRWKNRGSRS